MKWAIEMPLRSPYGYAAILELKCPHCHNGDKEKIQLLKKDGYKRKYRCRKCGGEFTEADLPNVTISYYTQ